MSIKTPEQQAREFWSQEKYDHSVDTYTCQCLAEHTRREKIVRCKVCGNWMCPDCASQHGRLDTNLCWDPQLLRTRQFQGKKYSVDYNRHAIITKQGIITCRYMQGDIR